MSATDYRGRLVVLDTETTGTNIATGDRIIEVGIVEMIDLARTAQVFHHLIDPCGQPIHPDAQRVHGHSDADVRGKPTFADLMGPFLEFVGDSPMVIHNGLGFDLKFINDELRRAGIDPFPESRVIDTLRMAKERFPGSPANLDALCKRLGVDNRSRVKHGALLDAELLADVFVELAGGRQRSLGLVLAPPRDSAAAPVYAGDEDASRSSAARRGIVIAPTEAELAAHAAFIASKDMKNAIWTRS